jgi:hypothetical protein
LGRILIFGIPISQPEGLKEQSPRLSKAMPWVSGFMIVGHLKREQC